MFRFARAKALSRRTLRIEELDDRSLPSFVAAPSYPAGPAGGVRSNPEAIVSGDFNHDGKMDVATANEGADGISVLLGLGNGAFRPSANFPTGKPPTSLIMADLNGDGTLDLVTVNKSDDSVTVLLGSGTGSFKVSGTFAAGSGAMAVAAGDLNGDGHVDLAVADNKTNTVTVLLGDGKGKFTSGGTITVGNNPTSVVVDDFNGDHHPDIATVSGSYGYLDINLNNGDGTFAAAVNHTTGFNAGTVIVGDFNGDHQPDLAVACAYPSNDGVSILLGNGDGTFQTFHKYDVGGQTPAAIVVADLNGDGFQDIVTANSQFANNSVSFLPGVGDGTFGTASVYTAGESPEGVAVGDFNGDGVTDVVTADKGTPVGSGAPIGTVTMLLGNGDGTLVATPDLVSDSPGPIIATDLTGDGIPDLAVVTTSVSFGGITLFPGLGDGTFGPKLLSPTIHQANDVVVGKFDTDMYKDLAVATAAGVTILPGGAGGVFGTPVNYAISGIGKWVAVDDFNGDHISDLVVATNNGVSILIGVGDGTFGAPTAVAAGGVASYVTTGDFNGDGKKDLAVVNSASTVSILFGAGDGTFGAPASYPTRTGPGLVSTGDFNHDGKTDLAVPTFFGVGGNSALAILINGLAGKFTQKVEYATDSKPTGSLVGDWNGDNKADIALVNNFADNLFVFGGTGVGTFGAPTKYVVGDRPTWLASADFNGDGKPDMAVVNSNSGTITLLETPTPATHFRVNVVPGSVTAGKTVQVEVSALDAAGHLLPAFTGIVNLTSTDTTATLPAKYAFTAADHGIHRFTMTLRKAGSQDIIAHFGAVTGTGTVQVNATVATHLQIVAPVNPVAGTPFDLTVKALDVFGNPDPSYVGTIHLVTTDKAAGITLPTDYTFTSADAGIHTFTGEVALLTAGLKTITATTIGALTVKGIASVTVVPGALHGFLLSGFPLTVTANSAHTFTVTAQDAYGNTITNYLGAVQFTNTTGAALLPAPYTFTAANKGKRLFTATFQTKGPGQSLTVTDTGDSGITGTETGITVT
ncbi:FG-GAP repeat domain-containing protein [Zavarzinella formosa]|uniref:FG-GAP repeat domain-containing protein n=1 Tax=Zavarzinella formosa TaxID=360055 RepID=UPI0002F20D93|nr:VCBS repeat-containing protein [Zavarzinella formosa]